jgi:hypothetical protein
MLSITLIFGLIVIIFFVLCIIYNKNNEYVNNYWISDESNHTNDIDIENKIELLELMNEAKNNATQKIKNTRENFNSLTSPLTNDEATNYLSELNFLNYWVQNNSGQNGIMGQINELVQNANNARITNKKVLVDILTNMYSMAYLDFLNHQNAEAYKIYTKYSNPKNNKYFTQF